MVKQRCSQMIRDTLTKFRHIYELMNVIYEKSVVSIELFCEFSYSYLRYYYILQELHAQGK